MKKITIISAFIFIALFAVAASAQGTAAEPAKPKAEEPKKDAATPVAKWEVVISAPGQDYNGTLNIAKDGEGFKGSVTTELGEAPMSGVKVKDDTFNANITVNAQGQTIDGTISGKVKDGKITGELVLNGLGSIPYTGKAPK
ncbi:hypothetical protein BH10ACI2_BH10ACI2_23070 [soil metagenome]